eukprot:TRINITY_DN8420_c0_g1_i1.p1 TRINITY_DN8420_c0_g1~~TRINITY_DN8420_c0_g1_i1.p1  ORF type:complete len:180 (+),score=37.46 TRINITY_DN8420_c0_g1_i1:49-588(+)
MTPIVFSRCCCGGFDIFLSVSFHRGLFFFFFFFNDTATTEIYTRSIVGSVRCVQETVSTQSTWDRMTLRNKSGGMLGSISSSGEVRNSSGSKIGYFSGSDIRNGSGSKLGTFSGGDFRNSSGSKIGSISSSGDVRNGSGSKLGSISSSGDARDGSGSLVGTASGIKPEWAAAYFFFHFF